MIIDKTDKTSVVAELTAKQKELQDLIIEGVEAISMMTNDPVAKILVLTGLKLLVSKAEMLGATSLTLDYVVKQTTQEESFN